MVHLSGENLITEFQSTADRITSAVSTLDGVLGIVLLGGISRGFVDKYSDLDVTIFLEKKNDNLRRSVGQIGHDEQKRTGIDVDLEVHPLEDFRRRRWTEVDRWDFAVVKVVFDPTGKVAKMISAKLSVPDEFWVRRVVLCSERMKWYCCPPGEDARTIAEAAVERGDLATAHYCISYGLDLLLGLLFALNKAFLPPPKWRIIYSRDLPWHPTDYENALRQLLEVKNLSRKDLERRLGLIRDLWSEISARIVKDMALSPEMISKYYVRKILHQD